MGDWISGAEAADIIGVHRNTVYRSLKDPALRVEWWGEKDTGWRFKPLARRNIYQVARARAVELAGNPPPDPPAEP